MVAIALFKKLYFYLSVVCYSGTGIIFVDEYIADGAVNDILDVNPIAQQIILYFLIVFWVLKIAWFCYDKFYLETKERKLKMESDQDDLDDRRAKRLNL
jgi:ABC-type polysaccharide/polyol phosphate export permease